MPLTLKNIVYVKWDNRGTSPLFLPLIFSHIASHLLNNGTLRTDLCSFLLSFWKLPFLLLTTEQKKSSTFTSAPVASEKMNIYHKEGEGRVPASFTKYACLGAKFKIGKALLLTKGMEIKD